MELSEAFGLGWERGRRDAWESMQEIVELAKAYALAFDAPTGTPTRDSFCRGCMRIFPVPHTTRPDEPIRRPTLCPWCAVSDLQEFPPRLPIRARSNNEKVPEAIRREVFARDGHRCKWCGTTENLCVDHIIRRGRGGPNTLNNLQTLCNRCNSSKDGGWRP